MSGSAPTSRASRLGVALAVAAALVPAVSWGGARATTGEAVQTVGTVRHQAPTAGGHTARAAPIDPVVRAELAAAGAGLVDVMVVMTSQADLSGITSTTRRARLAAVERLLRAHAAQSQAALLVFLREQRALGNASSIVSLWVSNEVAVSVTPGVVDQLAARPDVAAVRSNFSVRAPPAPSSAGSAAATVEPNISLVGAPDMWAQGFRGQSVVVAAMDTGVDVGHPDLASSWRGGANSWYDPNGEHPSTPTDVNGHGTQTMGVIVGGNAGGSSVGVAPAAQWVAVKIFDDRGSASAAGIHQGFQWLLDPDGDPATADAPNVVNNSWGASRGGCDTEFEGDLVALRAAGILPVFAAGNGGPTAGTVVSPANLPEALAVGGIDNAQAIDPSSSRGPSACAGAVSPKLTAPGVGIRTTDLYGGYVNDTGTSVAAPHVTGAAALILSALPGLSADRQEAGLESGAVDLGAPGLDDDFGYGSLDVAAAYRWLAARPDFTLSVSPSSATTEPGGSVAYDVSVSAVNGFASDVSLSLSGLPSGGGSSSFTPSVVAGGSGTSRLDVSTSAGLALGSYPLTVTATSGSLTRLVGMTLVVAPPPDFTVTASPASQAVSPGASTSFTVTVAPLNGFDDDVALSLDGLPATVGSATFTPPTLTGSGSSQLTISTSGTAAPGSYPLTVGAASGALAHTVTVTLVVTPDFTLTVSPTQVSVRHGTTAEYRVRVKPLGAFTGRVHLSASAVPPKTSAWFSRSRIAVPGASRLFIRTRLGTPRGTWSPVITATSGALVHRVTVSLTVS